MTQLSCPVCCNRIEANRVLDGKAYCACGAILNLAPGQSLRRGSNGSLSITFFTMLILGAIIHVINWDSYSLKIIPLKMKQIAGMAKPAELKEIASICKNRQKVNCEIQAMEQAFELDIKDFASLERVGELYMEIKNYHGASRAYGLYFKHGGRSHEARFEFAKALGQTGQFKEAQKQFHYLLKAHKRNPKFQVARSYVELLMQNNDFATAKSIIEQYRRLGPSSAFFLEKELKTINQKLTGKNYFKTASKGV